MARFRRCALAPLLLASTGCTALLGVDDLPFEEAGGAGPGAASGITSTDASASSGAGGGSGGDPCPGDLADCDMDGMCETDLGGELFNCGACGRACDGAEHSMGVTCLQGNCAQTCEPGYYQCLGECIVTGTLCQQPEVLPYALAADGAHLYATLQQNQKIVRYDRDLSNRIELATEPATVLPGMLLVYADHLFWGSGDGIRRMHKEGGEVVTLTSVNVRALDARGDWLYWAESTGGNAWRMPVGGGPSEQITRLASSDGVFDLAVSDDRLYYSTDTGTAASIAFDGSSQKDIAGGLSPLGKVVVDASVPAFWVVGTGIAKYDGALSVIVPDDNLGGIVSIAMDGTRVYYSSNAQQNVRRILYDGTDDGELATNQDQVDNVAVMADGVYWTLPGAIVRSPNL